MTHCDVSIPNKVEQKEVDFLLQNIGIHENDDFIALSFYQCGRAGLAIIRSPKIGSDDSRKISLARCSYWE